LTAEEASGHLQIDVWPDNVEAVNVFVEVSTQWRYAGMGSPSGLDYPSIESTLRMTGIPRKRWAGLFADVRVMERAALEHFANQEPARG
jgi:hypothetical protein